MGVYRMIRYVFYMFIFCEIYYLSDVWTYFLPDGVLFLRTAHAIYVQYHKFTEALSLAIRLGNPVLIREDFNALGNP